MNNITRYLNLLLSDYANKPIDEAYHLDVNDLPEYEVLDLVQLMIKEDTSLRDNVMNHLQIMINKHLPSYESDDRFWQESA